MTHRDGFSTVVCGPCSIDQARRPNAFVERVQIEACTKSKVGAVTLLYTFVYNEK